MKLFELMIFLLFFCSTNLLLCRSKDFLTEYPTYPTPSFSKVEKACKNLLLDLEAVNFNHELHTEWVEKSDYLLNQVLLLVNAVTILANDHEECRFYLLEDIHYLKNVLSVVEQTFMKVYPEPFPSICALMYKSLQNCSAQLATMIYFNQETI